MSQVSNLQLRSKFICDLKINGILFPFEIDTGAPVSIISSADARRHFGKLKLQPNDIGLKSYCGTPLEILGYIYVNVESKVQSPQVKLYTVRADHKPLLGGEWLRQIKLDWKSIFDKFITKPSIIHQVNSVSTITSTQQLKVDTQNKLKELIQRYGNLFAKSAGKIAGTQARMYIKEEHSPKFFKARRVPFSLVQAVEKEIEKLVSDGILEKVETSLWGTPIVPVPKGNGEVRFAAITRSQSTKHSSSMNILCLL